MKRNLTLGAFLALAAAAPAIVAPRVLPQAHAQDTATTGNLGGVPANAQTAEYPDVPANHWAYSALNTLSQAGVIEGRPGGNYFGNEPMTRYEFAVAIARLLQRIGGDTGGTVNLGPINDRLTTLEGRAVPDIFRADVVELINALRTEFRDELNRLGVRVTDLENRVTSLENRVPAPSRQSVSFGLLHRAGFASYINSGITGRAFMNGAIPNQAVAGGAGVDAILPNNLRVGGIGNAASKRFSYTDLELRLKDNVTDRLSATAALRSLGSTQEDPWTGDSGGGVYVRELFASADLSDRTFIGGGIKGLTANLGRQRTKIAQGLLYDNQLAPTDQIGANFRLGPIGVTAFTGTVNNQVISGNNGFNNPYLESGASGFLNTLPSGFDGRTSGATVGFASADNIGTFTEDNESLVRFNASLFRLAGQPILIGATVLGDGVANQQGYSFDATIPLFNRVVGFEYVRQRQYANGTTPGDNGGANSSAYIATLPALRTKILDLDLAYGRAKDQFEFFGASAANPYARTYGEAIFDRQMFLGAPLINGRGDSSGGDGSGTGPVYAAAKRGYNISGTARLPLPLLRKIPLDFSYYRARGTNRIDLGNVFSVGSSFNVTPGLDLELKFGRYDPKGSVDSINYYRLGANLGF